MEEGGIRLSEPYDWRISLRKAAGSFARDMLLAVLAAAGLWLSNPDNLSGVIHSAGPYGFVLGAAAIAAGRYLSNRAKNKDR